MSCLLIITAVNVCFYLSVIIISRCFLLLYFYHRHLSLFPISICLSQAPQTVSPLSFHYHKHLPLFFITISLSQANHDPLVHPDLVSSHPTARQEMILQQLSSLKQVHTLIVLLEAVLIYVKCVASVMSTCYVSTCCVSTS